MYSLQGDSVRHNNWLALTHDEAFTFLYRASTKRERNNGVIRHLERAFKREGRLRYERDWQVKGVGVSRLAISIALQETNYCEVRCEGLNADFAIQRANGHVISFPTRKKQRSAAKTEQAVPQTMVPRILRRQYRNRTITWTQAIDIVAYAFKMTRSSVQTQLVLRPNHSYPRYRLSKDGVSIEIEVHARMSSGNDQEVGIFCVKDNTERCYRRLRAKLKKMFHTPPKHKLEHRKKMRFLRLQRRFAMGM
jgi:hypothetical protein